VTATERDEVIVRAYLLAIIIDAERAAQRLIAGTMAARAHLDDDTYEDFMTASTLQHAVRRAEQSLHLLDDTLSDLACNEVDCGYTHSEPRIGMPREGS
jgi:hypothetical protein